MKFSDFTLSATPAGTVFIAGYAADGSDNLRFTAASLPISTATQTALDLKAPLAGPTFTGNVTLPSTTTIGNVSATELGYLDGVTSAIQTQLNAKLTAASNLSDLASASTARTNLGLGTAATRDVGQAAGNVLELSDEGTALLGTDSGSVTEGKLRLGTGSGSWDFSPSFGNSGFQIINTSGAGLTFAAGAGTISISAIGTTAPRGYILPDASGTLALTSDLTALQSKAEVKSGNFTAANDGVYTLVASGTVTDPSPVEGKGYTVFVRNGTLTQGANTFSTAGTILERIYHSGAWANYEYQVAGGGGGAAIGTNIDALNRSSTTVALAPLQLALATAISTRLGYATWSNTATGSATFTGTFAGSGFIQQRTGTTTSSTARSRIANDFFYFGGSYRYGLSGINFSRPVIFSGTMSLASATGATHTMRALLGPGSSAATGALSVKGVGIEAVNGAVNGVAFQSTLTAVTFSPAVSLAQDDILEYLIYSDGAGNATYFTNKNGAGWVLSGTTSAAPTGARAGTVSFESENGATATSFFSSFGIPSVVHL